MDLSRRSVRAESFRIDARIVGPRRAPSTWILTLLIFAGSASLLGAQKGGGKPTAGAQAPRITDNRPAGGSSGVSTSPVILVTFSKPMDHSSISLFTLALSNASSDFVDGSVSYDSDTLTAMLVPAARLENSAAYTVTVVGGSGGVRDTTGLVMTDTLRWSFTTGGLGVECPCSIWDAGTAAGPMKNDAQAVEVGVQFKSDVDGHVDSVRFFKYAENVGPHVGNLWTGDGTKLASVTFINESASGWQEARFSAPIAIDANTTYVVSYFTPSGFYASSGWGLTDPVGNAPLHTLPGTDIRGNGLYRYSAESVFPDQTFNATNYWVDVVFSSAVADTTAPAVVATAPASAAFGVSPSTAVSATLSEAMDSATITTSTFELRDSRNALVSSTVSYNLTTLTATLVPSAPLANAESYTATVKTGLRDPAGNALASNASWFFQTAAPALMPATGAGGPILLVTNSTDPFSRYLAEILHAEGLNEFATVSLSQVNANVLAKYDIAILSSQVLSPKKAGMFTSWVQGGGKLIAMRPDSRLAGLLGLTPNNTTLSNGYLQIDTTRSPGAGLVGETIQFHGTADTYIAAGATMVAALYADATTVTAFPAVTTVEVGANGGQAAAFTYDLARSVVFSRQGNPAWAGQDRDDMQPIRTNDLFYGSKSGDLQPDWIDWNKVAIPQADEQQRLLANLVVQMTSARRPLPRFWYFPFGKKAVVVMTGDDHRNGGTAGRFNAYRQASPEGCVVENWECVRSTSYVYPGTPLTDTEVARFIASGFEVALHVTNDPLTQYGCGPDFTPATLANTYSSQLAQFKSQFPSAWPSRTNRMHCLLWSDWSTQPLTELANGIRLDTSYYYWPGNWEPGTTPVANPNGQPGAANRPGFMTGSGMPMRFAAQTGDPIDVYQVLTQMTDESGQVYPSFVDGMLDNAVGAPGYYGVFAANMHTDSVSSTGSNAIVASAKVRGVPVVSAKQLLTWLDARNNSRFTGLTWAGNVLSFGVIGGEGSNGLQVMVPARSGALHLASVTLDGVPVAYSTQTIKGIEYAFIAAAAGKFAATYW